MVGLPGFEPGSIAPEATSLDQTSRQPLVVCLQALSSFRGYRNKYSPLNCLTFCVPGAVAVHVRFTTQPKI